MNKLPGLILLTVVVLTVGLIALAGSGVPGAVRGAATAVVLAPATAEFQVNTYTTRVQDDPTVAHLADGRFGIFWSGNRPFVMPRGLDDVFARVYTAQATPISSTEIVVDTLDRFCNVEPRAAAASDTSFAVVWREYNNGDRPDDVLFLGVVDQEQNRVGEPNEFADGFSSKDVFPSLSSIQGGGFVVSWTRSVPEAGYEATQVLARRMDASTMPITDEVSVTVRPENLPTRSAVASLPDGSFVVTWMELFQDGDRDAVLMRHMGADGTPAADAQIVNSYTTGNQQFPSVSAFKDGRFIVVWDSFTQDGDREGLFAQRFDMDGSPFGTEFQINSYTTGAQRRSVVVTQTNSLYSVFWLSDGQDGDGLGTFGRLLDWDTGPLGADFQVNTFTPEDQYVTSASADSQGRVVVTWIGNGNQDGDRSGVFAKQYCIADPNDMRCGVSSVTLGDPTASRPTATGALRALQAAVGVASCLLCECDADGAGGISASDALQILQAAVGVPTTLDCPPCCI